MNENWEYVPFKNLFNWSNKSLIKSGEGKSTGKYKMFICSDSEIKHYDEFLLNTEALVFGTGGKASCHYINEPFAYSTDCAVALPKSSEFSCKFYYYFLRQNRLQKLQSTFSGSGLQHTSKKKIEKIFLPILSKEAQERIVSKIEELFSQLDNSLDAVNKIKQFLKVYRQTVLHEAFASVDIKKPIREMASLVTSGSRGWAKYYSDEGARFVRITDLTRDKIYLQSNNIQCVSLPDNVEGTRSRLAPNDVLVSITADLGSIALISEDIDEAYINQHIALIRFYNSSQGKLMAWYLKSDIGQKDLLKNKRGAGKLGLGLDDIRDTLVPVVSDEVAKQTIEQIESQMSVCDMIEQTVGIVLQQAEAMRQSILQKAFGGAL